MRKKFSFNQDILFVLPAFLIVAGLLVFSIIFMGKTSFYKVGLTFQNMKFIGWKNYEMIFSNGKFLRAVFNTFAFSFIKILAFIFIGYIIAVGLTYAFKGSKVINAVLFAPTLIPAALLALVFKNVLEYKTGTVNVLLRTIGLESLAMNWTGRPMPAFISVAVLGAFMLGIAIMYYQADLLTIDKDIIDAAFIDGANAWKTITFIVFPLMKNTHKTILITTLIGGVRAFAEVFMLTNGGPAGSTEIIGTYIYKYISSGGEYIGFASAMSLIALVIAIVLSIIQVKFLYKEEK